MQEQIAKGGPAFPALNSYVATCHGIYLPLLEIRLKIGFTWLFRATIDRSYVKKSNDLFLRVQPEAIFNNRIIGQ